jgi:hypothetical protein
MVERSGKYGPFLSCEWYPGCKGKRHRIVRVERPVYALASWPPPAASEAVVEFAVGLEERLKWREMVRARQRRFDKRRRF